ncbi:MAG: hypothetical protein LIO96_13375, partial [Lachnospiraceae bacterium]|nr:hypothetical protein [Lachnospiraceae bacterium]
FLYILETDPALKQKAEELGLKGSEGFEDLISLAAEHNIILTEEDFQPADFDAISEDELGAVAGGAAAEECFCALCGNGGLCSCSASGQGMSPGFICTCVVGGYGNF